MRAKKLYTVYECNNWQQLYRIIGAKKAKKRKSPNSFIGNNDVYAHILPKKVVTLANTCPISNLQQGQVHSSAVHHLHTHSTSGDDISQNLILYSIWKHEALMLAKRLNVWICNNLKQLDGTSAPKKVVTLADTCPISNLQQGQVHSSAVCHLHTQHFWIWNQNLMKYSIWQFSQNLH